ncbi:hypothetical protein BWQ96_02685 [Gracilariopsis chorda]|uniref:Uncharacterized protein n=1 Tax=Gracilariopsis chorda TaxID=448386 RepID=A0A2V3IZH3_9FLOR|nr:hypothetical protein BWQ96_02685 [Gracilariopsis chorda]|eukprot:PXF47541.1 hypothetical protein BWQ96_02685 [Gracilariopsis chorda]
MELQLLRVCGGACSINCNLRTTSPHITEAAATMFTSCSKGNSSTYIKKSQLENEAAQYFQYPREVLD